jgi:hypothetical protein
VHSLIHACIYASLSTSVIGVEAASKDDDCCASEGSGRLKKQKRVHIDDEEEEEEENVYKKDPNNVPLLDMFSTTESGTPLMHRHPLIQWVWDGPNHDTFLSVWMAIPSGIVTTNTVEGKVAPSVTNDGNTLTIEVMWPKGLFDCGLIQSAVEDQFESQRAVVMMVVGAEKELNAIRTALNLHVKQPFSTTTNIQLNRTCEPDVKYFSPIMSKDTGGVFILVTLKVITANTFSKPKLNMSLAVKTGKKTKFNF